MRFFSAFVSLNRRQRMKRHVANSECVLFFSSLGVLMKARIWQFFLGLQSDVHSVPLGFAA